jgi:hypothetical protein
MNINDIKKSDMCFIGVVISGICAFIFSEIPLITLAGAGGLFIFMVLGLIFRRRDE